MNYWAKDLVSSSLFTIDETCSFECVIKKMHSDRHHYAVVIDSDEQFKGFLTERDILSPDFDVFKYLDKEISSVDNIYSLVPTIS